MSTPSRRPKEPAAGSTFVAHARVAREDLRLDRPEVQRGIKHAWFAQELAVLLEQVVDKPEKFARRAGVREADLRRLLRGEDLDRVSVDTMLRVVIQGRLHLQATAFARPSS